MYNIAQLSNEQREAIFNRYVFDYGGSLEIVEKDFWVTLMLDYLFHKSTYKDYFIFTGGTSLSKCYNIINRFSEDIDIILRWDLLTNDNPNQERSKTKQDKYNKSLNELAAIFIKEKLLPTLQNDFKTIINETPLFSVDSTNPQVIVFAYPSVNSEASSYIQKNIRLELGPLAALSPTENIKISPMIEIMKLPMCNINSTTIKTVTPERTFWEKILILHQESHRPDSKSVPSRYSRHYYDVYKISQTCYKEKALNDLSLLKSVREFKDKFYPSSWASYNTAVPGSFSLIPSEKHIKELKRDYDDMREMINENIIIDFEQLLNKIKELEIELNKI